MVIHVVMRIIGLVSGLLLGFHAVAGSLSLQLERALAQHAPMIGTSSLSASDSQQGSDRPGLAEALEAAWARHPQAQALAARATELAARQQAATSLLPAPPAVTIGNRNDRLSRNAGQQEWEAELGLPLWLPGEKAARQALVSREQEELAGAILSLRLTLAAKLRDVLWAAKLARNELRLAQQQRQSAAALAQDVARRVGAGELARSDLNTAQSGVLAAQAAELDAKLKLQAQQQEYTALTGHDQAPDEVAELSRSIGALDTHPALQAKQQAIAVARAKLKLAAEARRDSPELSLTARRERRTADDPYADSVGVKLRLPFASDSRNQPRIAEASSDLTRLEAEYRQERLQLALTIEQAQRELEHWKTARELLGERRKLASENGRLAKQAFDLGEFDLTTLLRAQAAAFEAELALSRADIEAGRAQARLNQALGQLPGESH